MLQVLEIGLLANKITGILALMEMMVEMSLVANFKTIINQLVSVSDEGCTDYEGVLCHSTIGALGKRFLVGTVHSPAKRVLYFRSWLSGSNSIWPFRTS